jgi:hypothetical protein
MSSADEADDDPIIPGYELTGGEDYAFNVTVAFWTGDLATMTWTGTVDIYYIEISPD